jgi:Kdo2-lipid IVA lauroyltransferase/acyltransferase
VHFMPAEDAIADADPAVAVAALNRGIEACIAIAPEQYQWTYKRLSFRPSGGPDRIYGRTRWFRRRRRRRRRHESPPPS